ncbi:MAG: hypothetical protein HC819_02160 [Cyclobacteriaceae bacterium]|nr:hypothetical protein [Cyclobacteriaceae bacterium]
MSYAMQAQTVIGVVEYIKSDDDELFLDAEKVWHKINEERLNEHTIVGWVLYKVMNKSTDDAYNYVALTLYDSFTKLDNGISEQVVRRAFPAAGTKERGEMLHRAEAAFQVVSSGVFHRRLSCNTGLDKQSEYYLIREIRVKPGKSHEYLKIKSEYFEPAYREAISEQKRSAWSLWEKWAGNMKDFQYVDVNGYLNLAQLEQAGISENFSKIQPDKALETKSTQLAALCKPSNTELWKVVSRVVD